MEIILNNKRLNGFPPLHPTFSTKSGNHRSRPPSSLQLKNQLYFVALEMYNMKPKVGIIIKWSPKFPPNSVHDLYHFIHWNAKDIIKMMDFTS